MNKGRFMFIVLLLLDQKIISQNNRWTWLYSIDLNKEKLNSINPEVIIERKNIPFFSQLIIGFNSIRPKKSFSFHVQAHDPKTKRWGKWHKMMDWGSEVQRSYMSSSDGHTYGAHVRLETEPGQKADGFRIKIRGDNKQTLKLLKHLYVTTSQYEKFNTELTKSSNFKRLASVKLKHIPNISQIALDHDDSHRICSPTSCSMVASYLKKRNIDPIRFAKFVFDDGLDTYGNWPFNTAHMYEQMLIPVFPTRLNSFIELHKQLLRGLPVIVSVRGGLNGAPKPYLNGHLFVVIGWDNKKMEVICHDPAFETHDKTEHRYSLNDFIQAWELSKRLAYWISVDHRI